MSEFEELAHEMHCAEMGFRVTERPILKITWRMNRTHVHARAHTHTKFAKWI